MFTLKDDDLLESLKDIPADEVMLGYKNRAVTSTIGIIHSEHEDGDLVYSHTYTYCNECESLRANLLYRLLSNQLPPIRLYLIPNTKGGDILLSRSDRLMDLFCFIRGDFTISGYYYRDLGRHKFRLRCHPIECFYFDPKTVDKEYVSKLLDVPSVFYPEIQQTSEA